MTKPVVKIITGDCRHVMAGMNFYSADAIITDPPYGLEFMGKGWDHGTPGVEFWRAAWRVLKPGGYLLAFGGTRTYHRLTCAIEDSGFNIRDCIMWVYGTGFPKSVNVAKVINAAKPRRVLRLDRTRLNGGGKDKVYGLKHSGIVYEPEPLSEEAAGWDGFGTALKPAWEPIIVAQKTFDRTVADNVKKFGTGALNIDGCRVPTNENIYLHGRSAMAAKSKGIYGDSCATRTIKTPGQEIGRFPANLIHNGAVKFPANAERFFYCAKASHADRDAGLDEFAAKARPTMGSGIGGQPNQLIENNKNNHPTVKPTALMRYLCRLVTPPGGVILDPFMGSGSTGKAAVLEGFSFTGIDLNADYCKIAEARINNVKTQTA